MGSGRRNGRSGLSGRGASQKWLAGKQVYLECNNARGISVLNGMIIDTDNSSHKSIVYMRLRLSTPYFLIGNHFALWVKSLPVFKG